MKIERPLYTLELSEPTLYVDNQSRHRSGHMSHAMAELPNGKIIDFNSNCSAVRDDGHSTFGFIEYKLSEDGGETYSDIYTLPYSVKSLLDGIYVISVEKAVACDNSRIVAICLRNSAIHLCQPWDTPMIVTSDDEGRTWSDPRELCSYKGRVYDACYRDGIIYVLEFCNDGTGDFCGETDEHVYRLFTSNDQGKSFTELCVVPIPSLHRGYGTMLFDDQGDLHVYAYNQSDEVNVDHIVSHDNGLTWDEPLVCYLNEGIRNPQIAQIDGVYVLHGRNTSWSGFVLYTSNDGYIFDEGEYIGRKRGGCYYSNNLLLKNENNGSKLLIQYSETYESARVNVMHVWLKVNKK